jgi:exodeoxyribonuclease-3
MKIVTWNVNGLRACYGKGFEEFFREADADMFCIQETKMQRGDFEFEPEGWHGYWNDAVKKGYSGTAVFTKRQPEAVTYGIGAAEHDSEGRVITLEYGEFYLVNVYVPNSQEELKRLPYRMTWDEAFRDYLKKLDGKKPVVVCGDFNVAHQEIDIKNPAANRRNAGFTDEEREDFSQLLDAGFADVFRRLNPEAKDMYTYWSYRFGARGRNAGWRIDYFCVSERLMGEVKEIEINSAVLGSDHCPVTLTLLS